MTCGVSMARLIISEDAQKDLARIRSFLIALDPVAAKDAGQLLANHIARLAKYPELTPVVSDGFRMLTIPFGKRGYSVAYVYEPDPDEVIVLGVKHQREEFFPFELESYEESPDSELDE